MTLLNNFLQYLVKDHAPITVFLTNGVKLSGNITRADESCLALYREGITQVVTINSIATVMPQNGFKIAKIDNADK